MARRRSKFLKSLSRRAKNVTRPFKELAKGKNKKKNVIKIAKMGGRLALGLAGGSRGSSRNNVVAGGTVI